MKDFQFDRVNGSGYDLSDKTFAPSIEAAIPGVKFVVRNSGDECHVIFERDLESDEMVDLTVAVDGFVTSAAATKPPRVEVAVDGVANATNGDFEVAVESDLARCVALCITASASASSQLFLYADAARTLEVYTTGVGDFTSLYGDRSGFALLAPDLSYLENQTLYGRISNTGVLSDYVVEMIIKAL